MNREITRIAALCLLAAGAVGAADVRVDAPRPTHDWDMVYRTFTNATEQIQGANAISPASDTGDNDWLFRFFK